MTTENPLRMMKKAFYFTLKVLFVLKIYQFLSRLFGHAEKRLDKVNFNIYDVTSWLTSNCSAHIVEILRSKGNQKMKLGQLIEHNMRNISEKSNAKCETIPRPFSKKSKLSISLDQKSRVLYSFFLLYAKLNAIEIY